MDAQVSTKSSVLSIPYPSDNQFIEFTNTGFVQDAAQRTVPFIDIQDVVSDPPVPLSGIGIYYKGQDGYGGFWRHESLPTISPHMFRSQHGNKHISRILNDFFQSMCTAL